MVSVRFHWTELKYQTILIVFPEKRRREKKRESESGVENLSRKTFDREAVNRTKQRCFHKNNVLY